MSYTTDSHSSLPVFEGFLEKRQKKKLMAKWSRRYVVLHENKQIRYYLNDEKDPNQMKIIDLNKVNVVKKVLDDHGKDFLFCFEIYGMSRKWRFAAQSEALRTEWCDHIQNIMFQEWVERRISVVAEKKVTEELSVQKNEWDHRREELEREREQIQRSLQMERHARNKSVRDLEEIKRSFKLEREDIVQRTSLLETQKDRLSKELQKYRVETNDRFAQLEAEYNDDLKQRDRSINQLEDKLRDASSKNRTVVRERDSLQRSLDDLQQQHDETQSNYDQLHQEIQQLQKTINEYEEKTEINNAADSKLVALTRTMAAKQKAWNRLRDELTDENDQLINDKENLQQEVAGLKQQLNTKTDSVQRLSEETKSLKHSYNQLESENDLLKREIMELKLRLGAGTDTSSEPLNSTKLQTQINNIQETQRVDRKTWKIQKKQIFTEINNKIKQTVLTQSHKITKFQINESYLAGSASPKATRQTSNLLLQQ